MSRGVLSLQFLIRVRAQLSKSWPYFRLENIFFKPGL